MNNQRDLGMNTVRVDKDQLLTTLRENRTTHVAEFDEAVLGYRQELLDALQAKIAEVTEADDILKIKQGHGLAVPASYEEDYTMAIDMLDWSIDTHVDLSQQDFKKYVKDEWAWKDSFNVMSATYNNKF